MRQRGTDPIPKRGKGVSNRFILMAIMVVVLLGSIPLLYISATDGGFYEVRKLASVKCLGCLGLDPVVSGFDGFWTEYPEGHAKAGEEVAHPDLVKAALDAEGIDVLVLFFWTQGCVPCAEQWEEMVDEDIASGPEDGGREGSEYDNLLLYSLDAAIDKEVEVDVKGSPMEVVPNDLYWTYHFNGRPTYNGVPCTVFIFESEGSVRWFMYYGQMPVPDIGSMMTRILYHEIAHSS